MDQPGYTALREGAAWIDLTGRGKIRAHGEDRARLLHAMTTNNVQALADGAGLYAFFLSAQGRIIADVNVFRLPDYLLLDTQAPTRRKIYEHLDKFIIADDVTLEDVTDWTATVNLEGPRAVEVLHSLGAPTPEQDRAIASWGERFVARVSATGASGFSVFVPIAEKDSLSGQLEGVGAVQADPQIVNIVRLENGTPAYGIDFGEMQIPQETNLMNALHFSKGCYLGQEIVERVRSRGQVHKMLMPVEMEGAYAPEKGAVITNSAGAKMGEITSAAFSPACGKVVGIAMMRVDAPDASPLSVNGVPLEVRRAEAPATVSQC